MPSNMNTLSDYINALYVCEFNDFKQAVFNRLKYTPAQWSDRRTGRTPLKFYELEIINNIYNEFLERRKKKL